MAIKDTFANRAYVKIVESGANTLTFQEMESGFGILEKRAWVISRIEYYIPGTEKGRVTAQEDTLRAGLSLSNKIGDVGLERPEVIDLIEVVAVVAGTPANVQTTFTPEIHDFSSLPGGGLIVAPKPIYGFVEGVSIGAAATVEMRIYFIIKELKDADFLQLLEMSRMIQ